MKLLRFGEPGAERPGLLDRSGNIRDLSAHINDLSHSDLAPDALARLASIDMESLPVVAGNPRLGACVAGTSKYMCIGLNYSDHAAESGLEVPPEPVLFMKATSAIIGPNDNIEIPRGSSSVDWEVELGVVIGRQAKYVDESNALDYVAGYCVCNDVSEREFQTKRSGQWTKGKSCDTFGPIGPWLVTKDEVSDPNALGLRLTVNDKCYQDGNTATMVYQVPFLVSYLSQFMSLQPGDIISTGTPPGVGMGQTPPVYLKPGDLIALSIEGLGTQRQVVVQG